MIFNMPVMQFKAIYVLLNLNAFNVIIILNLI